MKIIGLYITLLLTNVGLYAQKLGPAKVHLDNEHWTEYIEGNMPLVISVPHGGALVLEDVPKRTCTGAVTATDSRTLELSREIQKAFEQRYNLRPHIIICHLSRKHIDQNRNIDAGTCGNKLMEKPWKQFHHYIDTALNLSAAKFGKAIYIDLHGHGHQNPRLELGYLIKSEELKDIKSAENPSELAKKSSVHNLLMSKSSLNLDDLLVGDFAFGTLMAANGFPSVPSMQDKAPTEGEKYFNGGYNTAYFTSDKYPNVFGFQVECNFKGVRDAAGRPLFAEAFAKSMMIYIEKNTAINLKGKKKF